MRILLIAANRGEGVAPMFPLGPAYLAGNLGPGHELQALDLFLTPDYRSALKAIVSSFRPQIIGVSVRSLDMGDVYSPVSLLDEPRDLVAQCRELIDVPVVIGGAAVSIVPGEALSYLGADATDAQIAAYAGVAPLEASSAGLVRHRLNRGGNRRLNAILHRIALTQVHHLDQARDYLDRRVAEGKTWRESIRALKCFIIRAIWRLWLECNGQTTDVLVEFAA